MRIIESLIKFFAAIASMFSKKPKQVEEATKPTPIEIPKDLSQSIDEIASKAPASDVHNTLDDINKSLDDIGEAAKDWEPKEYPTLEEIKEERAGISKEEAALEITSQFEGAGWGGSSGNFDGQGISVGVLQWNFGQGTLQKLLKAYINQYGSLPEDVFPRDITKYADASNVDAVRMSSVMQDKNKMKPAWSKAWATFLDSPEGRTIQVLQSKTYLNKAASMASTEGMKSKKAFCFFFDVAVQNGSLKGVKAGEPKQEYIDRIINQAGENKSLWSKIEMDNESKVLLAMAWERASLSHSKYIMDVFSRKGTIAVGQGIVHKGARDFREILAEGGPKVSLT